MFDRLNYSLDDFLLFSERVYQRMFELHNAAIWPLHVPAIAIGLYLVFVAIKPSSQRLRISLGLLAIVWLFVAVGFFHTRYATINWAAAYVVPAFVLMALLLAFFAVRKRPLEARPRSALPFIVGLCVLIFSLIGYPLISALPGRKSLCRRGSCHSTRPDRDGHPRGSGRDPRTRNIGRNDNPGHVDTGNSVDPVRPRRQDVLRCPSRSNRLPERPPCRKPGPSLHAWQSHALTGVQRSWPHCMKIGNQSRFHILFRIINCFAKKPLTAPIRKIYKSAKQLFCCITQPFAPLPRTDVRTGASRMFCRHRDNECSFSIPVYGVPAPAIERSQKIHII